MGNRSYAGQRGSPAATGSPGQPGSARATGSPGHRVSQPRCSRRCSKASRRRTTSARQVGDLPGEASSDSRGGWSATAGWSGAVGDHDPAGDESWLAAAGWAAPNGLGTRGIPPPGAQGARSAAVNGGGRRPAPAQPLPRRPRPLRLQPPAVRSCIHRSSLLTGSPGQASHQRLCARRRAGGRALFPTPVMPSNVAIRSVTDPQPPLPSCPARAAAARPPTPARSSSRPVGSSSTCR